MADIFNPNDRSEILQRIAALTEDSERKWGTMTVNQMLCHTADQIRCSTGEKEFRPLESMNMPVWLVKLFVFYMPWPKSSPTVAEFDQNKKGTTPVSFEHDRSELVRLIHKLGSLQADQNLAPHPAFGPLSKKKWGKLIHQHLDWHLKQFSV